MPRLLRAFGEHGKHATDFNWCEPDEVVVPYGMVCDRHRRNDSCGCERSAQGVTSAKATTRAVVVEASDLEVAAARTALYEQVLESWGRNKPIAESAVAEFDSTLLLLKPLSIGQVVAFDRVPVTVVRPV